jgi:cell volume regulation protein A
VGLRGAAPIVLATFPLLAGIEKAQIIFNLVFFIVLTSVLVQGTLLVPAARLLKVSEPHNRQVFSPLAYVMHDGRLANDLIELTIPHGAGVIGRQIVELGLPDSVRIMLIGRDDDLVLPNGNTVIHAGDRLLLLSKAAEHEAIKRLLECEINV